MGKKNPEVMAEAAREVRRRAPTKNGISEKKATQHLRPDGALRRVRLQQVALDGLRLLAYQTAYLKANYPWHFAAALLTIEAQNTDKLALYLGECRERGIPVLPPDINESQLRVHRRRRAAASGSA